MEAFLAKKRLAIPTDTQKPFCDHDIQLGGTSGAPETSVQPPNAVDGRWFYERAVMYVMRLVFVGDEESAPSLLLQQRLLSCRCQCCLWMRSTQLTKSPFSGSI